MIVEKRSAMDADGKNSNRRHIEMPIVDHPPPPVHQEIADT
jgi:hypothetical protein